MWSFMGDPWLQHSGKYLWGAVQQAGAAYKGRGGHPFDFLLLFSLMGWGANPGPLAEFTRACGHIWVISGFTAVAGTRGVLRNKRNTLGRGEGATRWSFCCC
jgi:hypothetical protein